MFKILLVNMPCANLTMPSIALTQLKSVVQSRFNERVSVEVVYLNLEFANYLGINLYEFLTNSPESQNTGLGDWFFRQVAFPELPDNSEEYFKRYFPYKSREIQKLKGSIVQKRAEMETFMDELINKYKMDEADMVGFTSMFMQNVASFGMARKLKQRNPRVVTIIGGANCEFPMGRVIAERARYIDFVFSGPALKSFPEFVQHHIDGDPSKCAALRGVFSPLTLPESGLATIGEELSIDTTIPLDYDKFLLELEGAFPDGQIKAVLTFETSRGCWWGERSHCTFCGLNGVSMAYRSMKPELAIEQFNSLFRYSGRVYRLEAVDNILPKHYLSEVLPHLKTPFNMAIFYEVKADLSEQDIAVMANARIKFMQPGIESLATSTLKLMKKGTTAFQNVRLLQCCALYDIQPEWNLLIGFPGEGEEVYRRYVDVLPHLAHLPPPTGVYPVRFDRFSPYYDKRESYALELMPLDFYTFVYPFDEADLKNLAYYFTDRNIGAEYFTTMAHWIGKLRIRINEWLARWEEGVLPPRLYFKNNSTTIFDSRSGVVVEHSVGENGKALLEFLTKPTRLADIAKAFAEKEVDVGKEIEFLTQNGLVFRETDRLLSLVLEADHGSKLGNYSVRALPVQEAAARALQMIA